MRRLHYSISTERSYCDWITRFIRFHHLQSKEALLVVGAPKVERFLTWLAVEGNVSASTQNQALNVLVFLYKQNRSMAPSMRHGRPKVHGGR